MIAGGERRGGECADGAQGGFGTKFFCGGEK